MFESLVLIALVWMAQPASAASEGAANKDGPEKVARLVRQLNADPVDQRDSAEQSLIEMGPDALAWLPPVTAPQPAEVKGRLDRIRTALERRAVEAIAEPTYVSLDGELPLADAFQAVARQTGNQLVGYERHEGRVVVSFGKTPFWEALDELLDQAELDINPYGGQPKSLVLVARPKSELPRKGPAVYRGVFRLEATRVEAFSGLRNPALSGMRVTLVVSWEPRVAPIAIRQPLDRILALDNRGAILSVNPSMGALNLSAESGISSVELAIPFELPERGAQKISRMSGTLAALVPGRMETFEFPDVQSSRDVTQARAGVTVTFEQMRKNMELHEVRVRVRYEDAADALESHRGWIYGNEAYLLDAKEQRLTSVGFQPTHQSESEAGMAYLFELPKELTSYKFVYKTPAAILRMPVEYELTDIPLP